jgi:hypothetical protein
MSNRSSKQSGWLVPQTAAMAVMMVAEGIMMQVFEFKKWKVPGKCGAAAAIGRWTYRSFSGVESGDGAESCPGGHYAR